MPFQPSATVYRSTISYILDDLNAVPSLRGGGADSSVSIVTHYGLDGPGIESRWGTRFSVPVQTGPGSYTIGTDSLSRE